MSKAPAFQFYPSDWSRDLEEHPLEIEGAWIRLCCKLWWSETRGRLTKTGEQWSRILHQDLAKTEQILDYIRKEKIGYVEISGALGFPLGLTFSNTLITVISRRMERDEKDRNLNTLRQRRWYEKHKPNAPVTPTSQHSSSSSSTSIQKKQAKKEKVSFEENQFKTIPDALIKKWREVAPGISIDDEIKKAELWLLAHPEKRRSRYDAFLSNWMVRAQQNFIKYGGGNGRTKTNFSDKRTSFDEETERLLAEANEKYRKAKAARSEAGGNAITDHGSNIQGG